MNLCRSVSCCLILSVGPVTSCQPPIVHEASSGSLDTSNRDEQEYSFRFQVYEDRVDDAKRTSRTRGFVEHRRKLYDDGGIFYVYAVRDPKLPVGCYMPSGQTFRYRMKKGGAVDTIGLGRLEPDASVRVLLGIRGQIRLDSDLKPWNQSGAN